VQRVQFLLFLSCLILLLTVSCSAHQKDLETDSNLMKLTSENFTSNTTILEKFTCDGENISPALTWVNSPDGIKSFALICDDPDAPGGTFVHWIIFNIPGSSTRLYENVPHQNKLQDSTLQGTNDFGEIGYGGPCPPSGKIHHYHFTLYALDCMLDVPAGVTKSKVVNAMQGHILDQAELVGLYNR